MDKREYLYYFEEDIIESEGSIKVDSFTELYYRHIHVERLDRYPGELIIIAFPARYFYFTHLLFKPYNLNQDKEYFYKQCRDLISVPEKHQDEKGRDGKLNFQAYFHNIPESITSINNNATVVAVFDVNCGSINDDGTINYKLIGYVHANEFTFAINVNSEEQYKGYYYNMLRISQEYQNGKQVYRRNGIFSTMFAVLLDLVNINDIHFVYAAMGKANEKINRALIMLAERNNKCWDIRPVKALFKLTPLNVSKKSAKELIDISNDQERLVELYNKNKELRGSYMFNQYPAFDDFHTEFKRIINYSKTSAAYMITDDKNKMLAASVAVNWGDYFSFKLENPKGVYKFLDGLKVTDQLLFIWYTVGDLAAVKKLYRGINYKYYKEYGAKISFMITYPGDQYSSLKKAVFNDPYNFFVIYDKPEIYETIKANSMDHSGNIRIFIEPLLL